MDFKNTALAECAFHTDGTAVGLGDMIDDGEPQTGTAELPAPGFIDTVEPFKQPRQMFLVDSASLIGD